MAVSPDDRVVVTHDGTRHTPVEVRVGDLVGDTLDLGATIHAASAKATPVDADELGLIDSAAANSLKRLTWANLKATIKAYTDTLYPGSIVLAPSGGDDTAALSSGMDAANAAGKALFLAPGTYTSGKISKSYAPHIWAIPGTVTIQQDQAYASGFALWAFAGAVGSTVNLTSNAARYATTLVVTSTTGIAAGDLIIVGSNTPVAASVSATQTIGMLVEVASVDSGTQLTIAEPLDDDYTTAASATIKRVAPLLRPAITGLRFVGPGGAVNVLGLLRLTYARDVAIDVELEGAGGCGIYLAHCHTFTVAARARNFPYNQATSQFAYVVQTPGSSAHGRVTARGINTGSGWTGGAIDNEPGQPRDIWITGERAGTPNALAGGFTSHPGGIRLTYEGLVVRGLQGVPMELRSVRDARVIDCLFEDVDEGPSLSGECNGVTFERLTVRHTTNRTGDNTSGHGSRIATATCQNIRYRDCVFEDLQKACVRTAASAVAGLEVEGCTFRNWNQALDTTQGGAVQITGEATGLRVVGNRAEDTTGQALTNKPLLSISGATGAVSGDARVTGNRLAGALPFLREPATTFVVHADNTRNGVPVDALVAEGRSKAATTNYTIPGAEPTTLGTLSLFASHLRYEPIYVTTQITIDQVAFEVTTATADGLGRLRVGLYTADVNWQPVALVADWGEVDISALGVKTATASATLAPGRYLVAFNVNETVVVRNYRGGTRLMGLLPALGASPFVGAIDISATTYAALLSTPVAWVDGSLSSSGSGFNHVIVFRVLTP